MKTETKNCKQCKGQFGVTADDLGFYKKIDVPTPTLCPRCRQQRRILFRNFKTLYKRKSDKSGESVISMYSEKAPFPVWSHEEWWADDWDALEYGQEYDFNRSFFDQVAELFSKVPRFAVHNTRSENSIYSNMTYGSKNCYLVFGCVDDENCAYGHIVWESKDCFDNLYLHKSELCYECVDCLGSYRLYYSQECESCTDSVGLYDCRGCTNCIGCVGLKQKSYHVFNENVGKEGYEKFLAENPLHNPETIKMILQKQTELRKKTPQRHFFGSHNSNVSGNHIYNAKNMHHAFDVKGGENSSYIFTGRKIVDSRDISFTVEAELSYQGLNTAGNREMMCSDVCSNCTDIAYSHGCFNSHHIFGCLGVKGSEYCILNKRYSQDEFKKLKQKIIGQMKKAGEWGNFFPVEMSPFGYNESIAQEYKRLTKDETLEKGFSWEDDIPRTSGEETVGYEELPKNPRYYSDELLKEVLKCRTCGHNYRLIKAEVDFLKNVGLSLPGECFNCRHQRRMDMREPRILHSGKCAKCGTEFQTSHSPENQRKYRVFCEKCYLEELG